jgi:hypothetical protein
LNNGTRLIPVLNNTLSLLGVFRIIFFFLLDARELSVNILGRSM